MQPTRVVAGAGAQQHCYSRTCMGRTAMEQRLWVIDHAVAFVEDGQVTLQIDKPARHLPRREAFDVADKIWFAGQMRELEIARQRGETKEIPLTDRRRRSSVRMGGGFMITQGTKLVVVRRQLDAPRPGQLCECGGLFQYTPPDPLGDPEDVRNDYVASLLKESQEIVLVRGETLHVPQLAPWPSEEIGFEPPGTLHAYNAIIEDELKRESGKADIPVKTGKIKRFWMKMLDYEKAVRLEFSYSPPLSVDVTAEIDTSSLECVGVLSLPEDVDSAVVAFLDERHLALKKKVKSEQDLAAKATLAQELAQVGAELSEARKEASEGREITYWDCELKWDNRLQEESGPVDRDVYLIDIRSGDVTVWHNVEGERKREPRKSTLWKELSDIRLGPAGTAGRLATEKLERAMRMHCPFTHLQPLLTL